MGVALDGFFFDPLRETLDGSGGPPYALGAPYIFHVLDVGRVLSTPLRLWGKPPNLRTLSPILLDGECAAPLRRLACQTRNFGTPYATTLGEFP